MRKLSIALALACFLPLAKAAPLVAEAVDWSPGGQTGTLGTTTTVQVISDDWFGVPSPPPVLLSGASVSSTFGAPYFAGPVSLDEALEISIGPSVGRSYTFEFSQPVRDVRLSLASFASVAFVQNELGQQFVRESGQASFFVYCDVRTPCIQGTQSNAGTPNDANGTVLISGLTSRLSVSFQSKMTVPDGVLLQVSAIPLAAAVPEPASWALMLAGGLFVGRLARLRARRTG